MLMVSSVNISVFADSTNYKIIVENGRLEKVNHSIEKEYRELIKAIIATASDKMTTIYPKTFGHLRGSGLTLGLIGHNSKNDNSRAAVDAQVHSNRYPKNEIALALSLEINMIQFRWPGKQITEKNKNSLISTITHETMHAMMMEALTSGMTITNVQGEPNGDRFPNWFIEGTAVVSGGGTEFVDGLLYYVPKKKVNGKPVYGKHIDDSTITEEDLRKVFSVASLTEAREPNSKNSLNIYASYGTGYLACLYLGDLIANGGSTIDQEPNVATIRAGLDTLMSTIAQGYSLDQALKKLTKYKGLIDFEENCLDELASYSTRLIPQIKDGKGSALTSLNNPNTLDPESLSIFDNPTIILNDKYTRMINKYPAGHIVIKGGSRVHTGYDFRGDYPIDVDAPDIVLGSASIQDVRIDFINEKIIGLTNGEYLIDGEIVTPSTDGKLDIKPYIGKVISIVKTGHNYLKNSPVFELDVPARKLVIIEAVEVTENSITLQAMENAEYKLDDGDWQASPVFSNLEEGREYTVYQRMTAVANQSFKTEQISKKIQTLTTAKPVQQLVSVQVLDKSKGSNITGAAITVTELGKVDTISGETSNSFLLEVGKSYTISAEKADYLANSLNYNVKETDDQIVRIELEKIKSSLEPKPEPKPDPKAEPKPEPKPERKPEPKFEAKSEAKSELKPELKSQPQTEAKTKLKKASKPEPKRIKVYKDDFQDINKDNWYYKAVKFAYENNYMSGISKTSFQPNGDVSRAQVVSILYRLSGDKALAFDNTFADVEAGRWYTNAVNWANKKGIVSGVGNNKFAPNRKLTREEFITILYRYSQKYQKQQINKTADLSEFVDNHQISDYAVSAMQWAVSEGLIYGTADKTISPKSIAVRSQIASVFMRYVQKYGK